MRRWVREGIGGAAWLAVVVGAVLVAAWGVGELGRLMAATLAQVTAR